MAKSTDDLAGTTDYQQMLTQAEQSSPFVAAVIAEMRLRQQQMKIEQDDLLQQNKTCQKSKADISGDGLARKVRADLQSDQGYIEQFDTALADFTDRDKVPFSVRTHKWGLIFAGTETLFGDDESNISRIASGDMPPGCSNDITDFPVMTNTPLVYSARFWGTSNVTYLSNAILSVNFSLFDKTIKDMQMDSAITHIAPLPGGIQLDPLCRFAYRADELSGFGYVHSGFAFGGHRFEESLYPNGKRFGPEDCSSFIAKATDFNSVLTTADQLCVTRYHFGSGSFIPAQWKGEANSRNMIRSFQPVALRNVRSGDIYIHRTYDRAKDSNANLGLAGHTAVVLGMTNKGTVATLGYNRDMPAIEGFGIQEFPVNPKPTKTRIKQVMFHRQIQKNPILAHAKNEEKKNTNTAQSLRSY